MVDDITRRFGRRIDGARLDDAGDQGQGQGQGGHARTSASAIPTTGSTTRPLQIGQGRRLRQRAARRAVRVPPPARQARPAGRPHRVVDDAADGQRGQPAAAERAQLPGRHPAAAVLRSRPRRRPPTTAPSARPSATRSATASTTSAPVRRPGPARQLVDAGRTSRTSRRPARRWPRSTTPTGRSRTCAINGQLTLEREHRRPGRPGRRLRRLPRCR